MIADQNSCGHSVNDAPYDWEIRKCLCLSLAILLAIVGLIGLSSLGLDIPLLRQVVGFIFLTFVPGILILRILRIHNVGRVESLLYSVGLSITFIYLTGLFINFVLPLMGVSKPFSTFPLLVTLVVFTIILGGVAYRRDKSFSPSAKNYSAESSHYTRDVSTKNIGKSGFFYLRHLLPFILPLLAIIGAHMVNVYHNNVVLLFLLALIACVAALAVFNKLPEDIYPLTITMIALSLLFHQSLISPTLYGSDIQREYYFQHIVLKNGLWNATIPDNTNTCLSIVFLCPVYSLILGMDEVWVFKIIYQIFFSLVPLSLFHVLRAQIGARKAFLATFFFMASPSLIPVMITHAKQEIAHIFFALLILPLVQKRLTLNQRAILLVVFTFSLVVSHYALGYIVLFFLIVSCLVLIFVRSKIGRKTWEWLTRKSGGSFEDLTLQEALTTRIMVLIIGVYLVIVLGWYGVVSQGTALDTIQRIFRNVSLVFSELLTDPLSVLQFFESPKRESIVKAGLGHGFWQASILSKFYRMLQYTTQLFVVMGFFWMILKQQRYKFRVEFVGLITGAALFLFICIIFPGLSAYLGFERIYQTCIFLLAPLCVMGSEAIWQGASKLFSFISKSNYINFYQPQATQSRVAANGEINSSNCLIFLVLVILMPYFLFTSGFIYAFTSQPVSIALGPYIMDWYGLHNQHEVDAAEWLSQNLSDDAIVYADATGWLLLQQRIYRRIYRIPPSGKIPGNAYIFLRTWNLKYEEILVPAFQGVNHVYAPVHLMNRPKLVERFENSKVVYNNGGAKILAPIDYE